VLSLLRGMRDYCRHEIAALDAVPEQPACDAMSTHAAPRERFFWGLTLEYGQQMMKVKAAWLDEVIRRIENGEHEKGERNEDSGG